MERKSLFVNSVEILRIEEDKYLISEEGVLVNISRDEFVKELINFTWTISSWDEEVEQQFRSILEELKKNG